MQLPHSIVINEAFVPFVAKQLTEPTIVCFSYEENLDVSLGETLFENQMFLVKRRLGRTVRVYHDHKQGDKPYAVGEFLTDYEERIRFQKDSSSFFSEAYNCFSHIAFEEILLRKDAVILHAACIKTPYGGILFSGPSGIGKSTQADLWTQYGEARLINGDRTIIRKNEAEWYGYGSPYAGSSKCYRNDSVKIAAVVFLEQASECRIRKLQPAEAFGKLYSGMTVNVWNRDYVERLSEIVREMAEELPMYSYSCTKGREAVDYLNQILEEGVEHGK